MRTVHEIIVIWIAIILIILCFIFPPYGYRKIKIFTMQKGSTWSNEEIISVPWTYVGHKFIFSEPPKNDPNLFNKFNSDEQFIRIASPYDMSIEWIIVIVQVAIIIILTAGYFLSISYFKRQP